MVSLCLKALNEQQNPSSVFLNSKMEPHSSMFPCHQHFWINSVQFGITWKNYINFTFFSEFNFDRWFHVKSAKNDKNSFTSNKASDISLGVIHFVIGLISSKVSLTSGSLNLTTNSNSFWSVSKEDDSTASFHLLINLNSNFPAKISQKIVCTTYGDFWAKVSSFCWTTLFGEHIVTAGKSISQTGWFVESKVVKVGFIMKKEHIIFH